jgi:hypothetical protein
MSNIKEYDIVQNYAISALALWNFSNEFYKNSNKKNGPTLTILMPVLPMVLHKETVSLIYNRNKVGGFYRAITEDKIIQVGLQQRMEAMAEKTLRSLNLAFASGILEYNNLNTQIIPKKKPPSISSYNDETKKILRASQRLGLWFSELSFEQIGLYLKVRW